MGMTGISIAGTYWSRDLAAVDDNAAPTALATRRSRPFLLVDFGKE